MALEMGRQLPFSLEAEQSVLGAILIDPECIETVLEKIKAEYFYMLSHRTIFESMVEMFMSGTVIDIVTLGENLKSKNAFDSIGGTSYIVSLAEFVPSSANVEQYCKIINEKYYLRRLIEAASDISETCFNDEGDINDILDSAQQKIFDVMTDRTVKGFDHVKDVILREFTHLQELADSDGKNADGIDTGFSQLDSLLCGVNNSDLLLLAARPAVGKSAFAHNIVLNVAKTKKTVCIFSLEMSSDQIVSRMLSSTALVDSRKLRSGELDSEDWVKLAEGASVLSEYQILIDDSANLSVIEMKSKLRKVKNLGLVVIDYLQLMTSGKRTEGRVQEVSEITRQLKIMAKELNVPVITLSQLSRSVDSRPDHTPILSDLRESGSIEQDADSVIFLHRPDTYPDEASEETRNVAYCIVAKNRHGSTGRAELQWIGQYTKFASVDSHHNYDGSPS